MPTTITAKEVVIRTREDAYELSSILNVEAVNAGDDWSYSIHFDQFNNTWIVEVYDEEGFLCGSL